MAAVALVSPHLMLIVVSEPPFALSSVVRAACKNAVEKKISVFPSDTNPRKRGVTIRLMVKHKRFTLLYLFQFNSIVETNSERGCTLVSFQELSLASQKLCNGNVIIRCDLLHCIENMNKFKYKYKIIAKEMRW